jgi:hypothetical protein
MVTIGSKRTVYAGKANRTKGGITKDRLFRLPSGRIVFLAKRQHALTNPALVKWRLALALTRRDLGLSGFHLIKKDTPYYAVARKYYRICNISKNNLLK